MSNTNQPPPPSEELPGLVAEIEMAIETINRMPKSNEFYAQAHIDSLNWARVHAGPYETRRIAAEKRCAIYEEALRKIAPKTADISCLAVADAILNVVREALKQADREAPWSTENEQQP